MTNPSHPCPSCATNIDTVTRRTERAVQVANHASRVAREALHQLARHDRNTAARLHIILTTGHDPAEPAPGHAPRGTRQRQITQTLQAAGGWMTAADIGEACGMTRTYAADVARVLHQNGVVARRVRKGRNEFRALQEEQTT